MPYCGCNSGYILLSDNLSCILVTTSQESNHGFTSTTSGHTTILTTTESDISPSVTLHSTDAAILTTFAANLLTTVIPVTKTTAQDLPKSTNLIGSKTSVISTSFLGILQNSLRLKLRQHSRLRIKVRQLFTYVEVILKKNTQILHD